MGKEFTPAEKEKFEKIKELTLKIIGIMDNQKQLNLKRYQDLFAVFEKDPDAFRNWSVLNDNSLDSCPYLLQLPFEEVKMPQIKKAADALKIDLEDYIYYRHDDPRGIRSKMKVPVGYVHIKRLQQILSQKNHYTYDVEDRTLKTGDVKGESKVAALSAPESQGLLVLGAEKALEEFLGPRADNMEKKRQMNREISRDGYCTLESMESTRTSSTALNTLDTYLIACGIKSDLINTGLKTEYTLDQDLKR